MLQHIVKWFKLLQFRYYTGLALDNDLQFVELPRQPESGSPNISQSLQLFNGISKKTHIFTQSIACMTCTFMELAYENEIDIVQTLPQYCQLVYYQNKTMIIYSEQYNLLLLCFAGTKVQSLKDWWTNITGTYQLEWNKQKQKVLELLDRYPKAYIIVCGHSKGGIMSILAYNDIKKIDACYVAGVPDSIKNQSDLGKNETLKWEVFRIPTIEAHKILTYINILSNQLE